MELWVAGFQGFFLSHHHKSEAPAGSSPPSYNPKVAAMRVSGIVACLALAILALDSPASASSAATFYGGSIIAMAGDGCVGMSLRLPLGHGPQTVSNEARRVVRVNDQSLVGFTGLYGVAQQVAQVLDEAEQDHRGRNEPLRRRRQTFFRVSCGRARVFPARVIVAGLGKGQAYLCGMDGLGAKVLADDFVVAGSASDALYGACEASHSRGMGAEELCETLHNCMRSAMGRDCLSGGDILVHIVTRTGVESRRFAGRHD